jgi:iron complex transport system permease protein
MIYFCFLTLLLASLSLLVGPVDVSSVDASTAFEILWSLRLPRTIIALIVGGVLGLSGAVLQGFLRNPLVDASLLGIGSGAAFFAVLGISLGFGGSIPLFAVMGGALTLILLKLFLKKYQTPLRLILLGIALNSFYGALTALILNVSKDPYALSQIVFWLFGSYADIPWSYILGAFPFILLGVYFLFKTGPLLDGLSLGEDMAKSLGFSVKRDINYVIIGVGLTVGISVALCGVVGFIGLVVPHVMRFFKASCPSRLLLPSFMGGAILSLFADTLIRLMPYAVELKIGVMTALIGAPFFIYLLCRRTHDYL